MNGAVMKPVKIIFLLLFITATACWTAQAQDVRLQLDSLNKLEARAQESADISLDGSLLRIAISFLDSKKPKEAAIKDAVIGIKGIYVKSYEFDKEGEYAVSDVESVRTQLRPPAWSRMFGAKSKKEGENLEVYMMMSGNMINGIAVLSTEPKQLSVIQIVGSIDLEKLVRLGGKFGIPSIVIDTDGKAPKE
jgi:hypothetical protein